MNTTKYFSGLVSVGAAALWLLAGAQGCGSQAVCETCDCETDGCTTTTSGTDTTTSSDTETTTSTETPTTTSTSTTTDPSLSESVCQKICDCQPQACAGTGGIEECIQSFEAASFGAQVDGCTAEFNAAFTCFDEEFKCVNGMPQVDVCEPLIDKFNACSDGPEPDQTACDQVTAQINAKYELCGVDPEEPEEPIECTTSLLEALECINVCIQNTPCVVFNGDPTDQQIEALSECIGAC